MKNFRHSLCILFNLKTTLSGLMPKLRCMPIYICFWAMQWMRLQLKCTAFVNSRKFCVNCWCFLMIVTICLWCHFIGNVLFFSVGRVKFSWLPLYCAVNWLLAGVEPVAGVFSRISCLVEFSVPLSCWCHLVMWYEINSCEHKLFECH